MLWGGGDGGCAPLSPAPLPDGKPRRRNWGAARAPPIMMLPPDPNLLAGGALPSTPSWGASSKPGPPPGCNLNAESFRASRRANLGLFPRVLGARPAGGAEVPLKPSA